MRNYWIHAAVCGALIGSLAGCGSGGNGGSGSSGAGMQQMGTLPLVVSDASSNDWALIGVRVLSVALVPQGGGSHVTVYTAAANAPYVNLEQLDQLGEILGNVQVPVGTYTGAVVTVGGNPGDVLLTAAANPEAGFALPGGTTVSSGNIQILNTQGSSPNLTVPISVSFAAPLVVTTSQNNALDLEFDLMHPAFIVGHLPPGASATQWAVDFDAPVRPHAIHALTSLVLRHLYGTVTGFSTDQGSMTITRDFPTLPAVSPETAVAGTQSLSIEADATNGTLFYDIDAGTRTTIKDFSSESSLTGKYVRVAARYQENGTLVATRIWASSSFDKVWLSPEGHVLHVDTSRSTVTIENEAGIGVPMVVDANTEFYLRRPGSASTDTTPIGQGPSFLTSGDLVRGFKVHASAVDPLATPLVAQSIEIETPVYSGRISQATTSGFTYTHDFLLASDDYSINLPFISGSSANGLDGSGNAVSGYKWWNFAYPSLVDTGTSAVSDFVAAAGGSVNFGGTAQPIPVWGVTYPHWADAANPTGWSAAATALLPVPVPAVTVASALTASGGGYAFTGTAAGGTQPVTFDVSNTSGEATLVYQVDYNSHVVSVSPVDITTASGLTTFTNGLAVGTKVRVAGVPQPDGTLKAYVVTYFTNTTPAS